MIHRVLKRSRLIVSVCLGLAALACAALLMGRGEGAASAQGISSGSGDGGSLTLAGPHMCTISNIAVFESRIHVFCTTGPAAAPNVRYFAASTSNAMFANRLLTLMNTAFALGKQLGIYYEPSSAYNPSGCQAGDCRAISWIFLPQ